MLTTNGAARHANTHPSATPATASIALSTSTNWTSRARPAPIATLSAISRARLVPCAISRFAKLAHAISRIRHTSTPSAARAARYSCCKLDTPVDAGSTVR